MAALANDIELNKPGNAFRRRVSQEINSGTLDPWSATLEFEGRTSEIFAFKQSALEAGMGKISKTTRASIGMKAQYGRPCEKCDTGMVAMRCIRGAGRPGEMFWIYPNCDNRERVR